MGRERYAVADIAGAQDYYGARPVIKVDTVDKQYVRWFESLDVSGEVFGGCGADENFEFPICLFQLLLYVVGNKESCRVIASELGAYGKKRDSRSVFKPIF